MERFALFCARFARALRYYRHQHFSWRLAWVKSGNSGSALS